mgnify:CR=1 FL=1
MRRAFESATLKLTGWYLMILMIISLLFSTIIYQLSTQEVSSRLESLQLRLEDDPRWLIPENSTLRSIRQGQADEAKVNIFFGLLYINLFVLGMGGVGSYLLARRTLRPIEEMHEAQSRFTSDASHELKTPLAVMKSELELALRDSSMKKQDYRQVVESTLEEVDKLTGLTHTLLQLSRMDLASIDLTERVDINQQLKHVQKLLDSKSRIKLKLSKQAAIAEGNESMLRDLFVILVDNALRYSPESSPVEVTSTATGKSVTVRISNAGKGISADDLPKIFDRFYRADSSRTSQSASKGYGLGLSLAKNIADTHNADIQVVSEPSKQTTFTVVIPKISQNH